MRRGPLPVASPTSPPISHRELKQLEREASARAARKLRLAGLRSFAWWCFVVSIPVVGGVVTRGVFESAQGDDRAPLVALAGTLTAALLAGAISISVFVLAPARQKRIEKSLAFVETQISDLWGPLYGEIRASRPYFDALLERLHEPRLPRERSGVRRAASSIDPFKSIDWGKRDGGTEWAIWAEFIHDYFLPRNARLAKIIVENYELVGQDPAPSVEAFLEHEAEFRVKATLVSKDLKRRRRHHEPPLPLQNYYPEALEYHVHNKLHFLLFLQKKYRTQIEKGIFDKDVRRYSLQATKRRVRSTNPPAKS